MATGLNEEVQLKDWAYALWQRKAWIQAPCPWGCPKRNGSFQKEAPLQERLPGHRPFSGKLDSSGSQVQARLDLRLWFSSSLSALPCVSGYPESITARSECLLYKTRPWRLSPC